MQNNEYYAALADLTQRNEPLWQVTIITSDGSTPAKPGMKMLIPLQGKVVGNLGGGEMEHTLISLVQETRPEKPQLQSYNLSEQGDAVLPSEAISTSMICGGQVSVFIEPLYSVNMLYIIGAGHCGRALAHMAGLCGFQTRLIDNRSEILADIPSHICSDLHHSDYSDLHEHIRFDKQALIVIMTHGHLHDRQVMEQCLNKPSRYVGMIGSATKVASTLQVLKDKGYSADQLSRIHAPIGLPIGSQTPYEIAVSILAQLIKILSAK